MNRTPLPRRVLVAAGIAVATLGLSACVVAPVGPYGYSSGYYGEPVAVAPPPAQVEYYGAPPVVGQIWIGGHWNWSGGRYAWNRGYWTAPRPGYRWSPHRWEQSPRGWQQRPGRWERR